MQQGTWGVTGMMVSCPIFYGKEWAPSPEDTELWSHNWQNLWPPWLPFCLHVVWSQVSWITQLPQPPPFHKCLTRWGLEMQKPAGRVLGSLGFYPWM
jgi:hypothetical protein